MSRGVRLGIVGCGRVAEERHLPALRHVTNVDVVAATDVAEERVEKMVTRWGIANRYTDHRAMLRDADIDAVGVLTPTDSHAEIAIAALDADKHVLIEKPLALDLEQCDRMIERAERSSRVVVVGFNLRWHRLVRRARAFIETGALGAIKAIRSTYTHFRRGETAPMWHRELSLGGGVSFNEAVHHFDLWRFMLQADVDRVFGISRHSEYFEDETHVTSALLSNGALATGVFTFSTSPNSEIEIYGEKGRLYVSCYRFDGFEFFDHTTYPGDVGDRLKKVLMTLREIPEAIPNMRQGGDFQATFCGLWRHFIDCIENGKVSECSLEDGKRALAAALATNHAVASDRPVRVSVGEDLGGIG